jgi:hypothetical protein
MLSLFSDTTTETYTANALGDVLYSGGLAEFDAGETYLYGMNSGDKLPINSAGNWIIGDDAQIFALGANNSNRVPDIKVNGYVQFVATFPKETTTRVTSDDEVITLVSADIPRDAIYAFFTSNAVVTGSTYKIFSNTAEKGSETAS